MAISGFLLVVSVGTGSQGLRGTAFSVPGAYTFRLVKSLASLLCWSRVSLFSQTFWARAPTFLCISTSKAFPLISLPMSSWTQMYSISVLPLMVIIILRVVFVRVIGCYVDYGMLECSSCSCVLIVAAHCSLANKKMRRGKELITLILLLTLILQLRWDHTIVCFC